MNQNISTSIRSDDSISLMELWKIVAQEKVIVIFTTVLISFISVYYALSLPVVYKASVLSLPLSEEVSTTSDISSLASIAGLNLKKSGSSQVHRALTRLKTVSFLSNFIREYDLKTILLSDQWNIERKNWRDVEPSDYDAAKKLQAMIEIDANPKDRSGLVIVSIKWENPSNLFYVSDISNKLISAINNEVRKHKITESESNMAFLKGKLKETDVLHFQKIIFTLIEKHMQESMLANTRSDFVLDIIDPATIPMHPESSLRLIVIIAGLLFGSMLGVILAVIKDALILKK